MPMEKTFSRTVWMERQTVHCGQNCSAKCWNSTANKNKHCPRHKLQALKLNKMHSYAWGLFRDVKTVKVRWTVANTQLSDTFIFTNSERVKLLNAQCQQQWCGTVKNFIIQPQVVKVHSSHITHIKHVLVETSKSAIIQYSTEWQWLLLSNKSI
jgi:hypothetical protein